MDDSSVGAFEQWVTEHRDRALGLAWRLLGADREAAEDVVQEAFVRAHRGMKDFRGNARLSTWFYRILVNEVQRHRRRAWLRDPLGSAAAEIEAWRFERLDLGRVADHGDPSMRELIARALDRLPRRQREVFVLVHLEGFTVQEVAEITRLASGTVKSHLHRALASLRRDLAALDPRSETPEPLPSLARLEGTS